MALIKPELAGFDDACRSQDVFADLPIIEASFWLTVAGTARRPRSRAVKRR